MDYEKWKDIFSLIFYIYFQSVDVSNLSAHQDDTMKLADTLI